MRKALWYRIGILALSAGLFTVGVSPSSAQTTSVGPYYATPLWDQTLPAATRFIILSNFNGEAVLDRETGLVWEKSPLTTPQTWDFARLQCTALNGEGKGGRNH